MTQPRTTKPATKKSPTPSPAKTIDAGLQVDTPKRSGTSVALAAVEFSASDIGDSVLADPLLMDCYRARREEGGGENLAEFILWQAKIGLQRELPTVVPLLAWDKEKGNFCASPLLNAYRARRRKADKEPVLVGEGWDEAFAELIVDVVKERVRQAERCPAAGA